MKLKRIILVSLTGLACVWAAHAQPRGGNPNAEPRNDSSRRQLTITAEVVVPTEVATSFRQPMVCDQDGNVYLETDEFGVSGIHKINLKGELITAFRSSLNPDLRGIDLSAGFSVTSNGEVYELVYPHDQITRYIIVYRPDGTFKANIKLQPGFAWLPSAAAVFPNGTMLITGQRYDSDVAHGVMWPVTAIFSSDGALLKDLDLEDDVKLRDKVVAGDARFNNSLNPTSNRAISLSRMELGSDGNIYLMRSTTPAIVYAISSGGEVIKHFAVDPRSENGSYRPIALHVSGRKAVVLFDEPQSHEKLIKVVDLDGVELATYTGNAMYSTAANTKAATPQPLGGAFACYTATPERFIFLGINNDDKLQFRIADAH